MTRTLALVLFVAAAGCGGKDKGPSTPGEGAAMDGEHGGMGGGHGGGGMHGEHGGMMDGDMHANLSPEMKAFHDLLAPRWHAEHGAKRQADTCDAVEQFKTAADGIGAASPPASASADTWSAGASSLVTAVGELQSACAANGGAGYEPAFGKVHDAFHALMMQGMHSGGGGEHAHGH